MTGPEQRRPSAAERHQEFDELAVGHALSALEPEEESRFLAHLAACARCEQAVAEHQATLAHLAHTAPSVELPPSVLEGIRAAMRAESREVALAWQPQPAAAASSERVVDLSERRRRRSVPVRRSHLLTSAAAVAALLLGLGGWNASLQRDNAEQSSRLDSIASAVRALESPDTRTVRLSSPDGDVKAVAVMQGEQMSLVVDGLEPNPDDTVYVLWGQSSYGDVRAVGAFDVSEPELKVLDGMRLEPSVGDVTALMVTHEKGRTPPAMTTQPVLARGDV